MSIGFLGALLTLKMNAIYECPLVLSAANRSTSIGRYGWRLEGSDSDNNQWTACTRPARAGHECRAGPQCRRTKERPLFYGSARPFYVLQVCRFAGLPSILNCPICAKKQTKIVNVWFILLRLAPKHETQLNYNCAGIPGYHRSQVSKSFIPIVRK